MKKKLRVLIVEDSEDDAVLLLHQLSKSNFTIEHKRVDTKKDFETALNENTWDIILSDYKMPHFSGANALAIYQQCGLDIPFIIVSGTIGEEIAVNTMKAGAHDYIMKDNLKRLLPTIERELRESNNRAERKQLEWKQRQAEEAIQKNAMQLNEAQHVARLGSWESNISKHTMVWSDEMCRILEVNPEQPNDKYEIYFRAIHPDDRTEVETAITASLQNKTPYCVDHRLQMQDGRIKVVRERCETKYDKEGVPVRTLGTLQDITEQKQAEEELQRAKDEWERTFDAITDPIIVLDTQFHILKANKAMAAVFEMEPEGILGLRCYEAVHGRKSPPELCPHAQMLKDGCPHSVEIYEQKLGGNFNVSVSPLHTPEGTLYGSIHIARNITERKEMEQALRESEHKYRKIFENVQDVFYQTNREGIITEISPSIERYSPFTRNELIGTPVAELYRIPKEYNNLLKIIQQYGEAADYELQLLGKSGKTIFASINSHRLNDTEGNLAGFEGAIRDISERKRSEREMIMLSQAIKSVSECISVTDEHDHILFINAAFLRTYGYTKDELIGKNISIVRSENNPAQLVSGILPSTLKGTWEGEVLNKRKDGSEFLVYLSTTCVRDEQNDIIALIGVAKDITEERKAEAALRESEERHRLILHTALDGFWLIDTEGRFLEVNETYCKMSGFKTEELLMMQVSDLGPKDSVKDMISRFNELVTKGEDRFESQLCRKNGTVFDIEVSAQYRPIENGRIVAFLRDITEKKLLEAQFLRAQRLEGLGTLAGGIAHDLNNVLAPVLLSVEILKKTYVSESSNKILESVEASARRGSEIVKQILAFARGVETQKILLQPRHLIKEIVGIFKETFSRSISIISDIPATSWTIIGDPTHFHQLIMNLGVNARDAMPDGGTLSITATNVEIDELYTRMNIDAKPGRYVMFSIHDTGIGMSPETLDHIFEPFFTTKEIGKGTGLGMSTVYSIVKSHNGFIKVASEQGKGTTVNVYLPASEESFADRSEKTASQNFYGNGELILVVDDEMSIREVTKQTLESYNYTVITASDGAEGITRFSENRKAIKLVITDIMMPVMDGKHLIITLHKIDPDVKIIASSGLIDKTKPSGEGKISANGFIDKPYTSEKLMNLVASVLKGK
ncbi:MAG: PAS domain S-box protein [Bacteriovoracaceae bacterium]|nr:PAS domain S-box protein [Bacteroidota bacterium]